MITPAWYPAAGYLRAAQQLKARGSSGPVDLASVLCLGLAHLLWELTVHLLSSSFIFGIHHRDDRRDSLHLCAWSKTHSSSVYDSSRCIFDPRKKESQFEFSKIHLQVNMQMHQYWLYHPYFPLPVERGYFFVVRKQCNRQLHSLTVKSSPP